MTRRFASSSIRLAAAALALVAAAGCSGGPKVLARVGNETITAADFTEAAKNVGGQYPALPDTAKAMLLRDLIQRKLLVVAAKQGGLYRDTTFLDYKRRDEERLLRQELFERMAGGPFPVTPAEVQALYERRDQEIHARVLFAMSEEVAKSAQEALAQGQAFPEVCDRFNPPRLIPPGGDLGFIVPGNLMPMLDDLLVTAPLNEVVGPVHVPGQGWFLMRIEERRPRDPGPLEGQRAQLEDIIKQRKQRAAAAKAVETLTTTYDVKVDPKGAAFMAGRLRPDPRVSGPGGLTEPPILSEAERATVVATWTGRSYTLADAMADLAVSPGRPNFAMLPQVERWIESQAVDHVALLEARKRRIDREPEFAKRLTDRLDNFLLDGYYQSEVLSRTTIDEADVRAAYQARASSFQTLQEVRMQHVTFADSAAAAQLTAHGAHAGTLREAAAMAAPNLRVRDERVRFPTSDARWNGLYSTLLSTPEKDYVGPLKAGGGWMVLQIASKRIALQPLEALPANVQQSLMATAMELKREARLTALTDSLRAAIPVSEFPKELEKIEWPAPGSAPKPEGVRAG
jgi:hypothetical protein